MTPMRLNMVTAIVNVYGNAVPRKEKIEAKESTSVVIPEPRDRMIWSIPLVRSSYVWPALSTAFDRWDKNPPI